MYRCYQTIGPNQWLVIALNHSVWIYTAHFNDSFKWLSQVYCSVFPFGNYNCICFCILSKNNSPSVVGQCYWVVYYSNFCLVLEPVIVMSGCLVLYLPPNNGWIVLGITILRERTTPVIFSLLLLSHLFGKYFYRIVHLIVQ